MLCSPSFGSAPSFSVSSTSSSYDFSCVPRRKSLVRLCTVHALYSSYTLHWYAWTDLPSGTVSGSEEVPGVSCNSRVWLQACIGCRVYVYVLRTALRVPEVCTFANNNRGLSTTQFHGRNASPSHSSHWNGGERRMSATGGKGPWAKLSGRRARSARGFGG